MSGLGQQSESTLIRWLPFLAFWRGPKTFTADLFAGLTVGLVLVPQAMAYANLAGMPPETGLYAASFACIAGAMFGRCAQLHTGPVAMTSILSLAAVTPLAAPMIDGVANPEFLGLMAALAIMVGILRIVMGLMRGAALAALISAPVLIGFGTAAGIIIASTQVPKFFQVNPGFSNKFVNGVAILGHLTEVHLPTLLMGTGSLVLMILFKKFAPRWPGLLIALVIAGLVSWLINFEGMGGKIIGNVPQGLPGWGLPELPEHFWSREVLQTLLTGAVVVTVIGLLEVMTVTGAAERKHGTPPDLNGELMGQGAASFVAGLTSGFPVSGSLSRSGLSLIAGARTGMSSVISAGVVILTLIFLTPLLRPLPLPALAAAIVMAVSSLVRPLDLIAAFKVRRSDGIFGMVTLVATLALAHNMVLGMAVGVGLNVMWFLRHVMQPRCVVVSEDPEGRLSAVENDAFNRSNLVGGRLVIRIDSRVNFLNARTLGQRVKNFALECPGGTPVVVYSAAINDIDQTGLAMITDVKALCKARGLPFALADVKAPVRLRLEAYPALADLVILPRYDSRWDECFDDEALSYVI